MLNVITWVLVILVVCVGNYVVFTYVGLWTYIAISLGCGVVWMLFIRWRIKQDHKLQMILAKYAIQTDDTTTNLTK